MQIFRVNWSSKQQTWTNDFKRKLYSNLSIALKKVFTLKNVCMFCAIPFRSVFFLIFFVCDSYFIILAVNFVSDCIFLVTIAIR